MISKWNVSKLKFQKSKETLENAKTLECVELFQNTFFAYEKIENRLKYYQEIIRQQKENEL